MKTRMMSIVLFAFAAAVGLATPVNAALIRFDFGLDNPANPTPDASWTESGIGGATDGTVTVTPSFVGGAGALAARDRGTAGTPQGVDNGDIFVPAGTYGDMYRDFIANFSFAGGTGLDLAFTGLVSGATYDITVWGYSSGYTPVSHTWGPSGGATVGHAFVGDLAGAGPDPNTTILTDYSASFQATAVGTSLTIEGRGGFILINGIELSEVVVPTAPEPSTFVLAALSLVSLVAGRRRRQRA